MNWGNGHRRGRAAAARHGRLWGPAAGGRDGSHVAPADASSRAPRRRHGEGRRRRCEIPKCVPTAKPGPVLMQRRTAVRFICHREVFRRGGDGRGPRRSRRRHSSRRHPFRRWGVEVVPIKLHGGGVATRDEASGKNWGGSGDGTVVGRCARGWEECGPRHSCGHATLVMAGKGRRRTVGAGCTLQGRRGCHNGR